MPEPLGGAHRDPAAMMNALKQKLKSNLERLCHTPMAKLLSARYERLMGYGAFTTTQ